jgi:hypothetical protein
MIMAAAQADSASANPYAVFAVDSAVSTSEGDERPIVLNGELGLDQWLRGHRVAVGSRLRLVRPFIMLGALAVSIGGTAYGWWRHNPVLALGAAFQAAALGAIGMAITSRHGTGMIRFNFYIGLQKPVRITCTLSSDGVQTIAGRMTLDDPWSRFSGFTETEDMIILWRLGAYVQLPKEFAKDEGEWQRLREFLYARLPLRRV